MTSLKSFIKSVRQAKTIADERAVIQKESAAIRTSFRENHAEHSTRRQNVAKLLYLFTLGERTHFGQVECLKLLATSKYTDKRLGYLGTMLLLDESQEVLTLVTNSLSNDLASPNQYVVALALCTLGNIASQEMARDLFADIEKIISSSNNYLKKKAALCAMRIVQRVPDLEENFFDKAKMLLNDKHHGVLLCGAALIEDMCLRNPDVIDQFKDLLPTVVKHLKNLGSTGYAPEHDVTGITDPFLQVKLLRLLRLFGQGDTEASERMNDILAQVASNTDSSKNVGNAVLYEAVQTIFGIEADSGLRVLGVNILGKFLTTKDNNTKYVALNTLLKVIEIEPTAVQRHRATILECLKDADISIRRRALELSYALINEQNVRVLVRELLAFLETADVEFKTNLVSQIAMSAERFAPNKRWHIDTILRALKLSGNNVKENVLSSFITLVITCDDEALQLYAVQKLYSSLKVDITQEGLTLVGVWLIGEYGNTLVKNGAFQEGETTIQVSEQEVVSLLETVLASSYATDVVREYVVNSLMKLSVRFSSSPAEVERIRRVLQGKAQSLDIELQQRVVEYGKLFNHDSVRRGVLEKMPPPELREDLSAKYQAEKQKKNPQRRKAPASAQSVSDVDLLLDLTGPESSGGGGGPTTTSSSNNNNDLLNDIFGGSSNSGAASLSSPAPASPPPAGKNQNILDLFDAPPAKSSPPVSTPSSNMDDLLGLGAPSQPQEPVQQTAHASTQPEGIEAYNKNGLHLQFEPQAKSPAEGSATITARFQASDAVSNLALQVAVPKRQQLQLQALSQCNLSAGSQATQLIKVTADPGAKIRLRLRISYTTSGGEPVTDQVDFDKFGTGLV